MDRIIFSETGDSNLDALLFEVFQKRHPREDNFPRGCRVLVTMPLPALAARLSREEHIPMSQAMGLARYLQETPSEVLGIEDLTDEAGVVKPYASIMSEEGYLYPFELEYLRISD